MQRYRFLLLSVSLIMLWSCDRSAPEATEKVVLRPVKTVVVEQPDSYLRRGFPGVVEASKKAELAFRVSGTVEDIYVKEGDQIQKGQKVASLDKTDYEVSLSSAQSEFSSAKADYDRASQLVKKGHISRSDFDQLKVKRDTAESNLKTARLNLSYSQLKAPFDGEIAKRYKEKFEEVNAKEPVLMIQNVSLLKVKVNIPESVMLRVQQNQKPPEIFAFSSDVPDVKIPLTLSEVATRADDHNQTFEVTFEMQPVESVKLLPGMSVQVYGKRKDSSRNVFYLPAHSILHDSRGHYIYVTRQQADATGIVERRDVSVGELTEQGIEIHSGLNTGDRVIVAGVSQISDGMQVKLATEE